MENTADEIKKAQHRECIHHPDGGEDFVNTKTKIILETQGVAKYKLF